MRKLTTAAAMLAFAGSAQAADLYVKAPAYTAYDWSGIYVGANAGYGWGDMTWNFAANAGPLPFSTQPNGALAGGQIGINRQFGNWVWGTEVTGAWSGLSDSGIPTGSSITVTTKLRDLETLTGRLGYAFNNVLFYAKSGGATGVVSADFSIGTGQSQRLFGTTTGAGIEYGLTPNFILGVEYDYTRLFAGQYNVTGIVPFGAAEAFTVQSVLGRVSYKF